MSFSGTFEEYVDYRVQQFADDYRVELTVKIQEIAQRSDLEMDDDIPDDLARIVSHTT